MFSLQAFADILMLYEFLQTFGETLGFDMENLPLLDSLQRALLYDSRTPEFRFPTGARLCWARR